MKNKGLIYILLAGGAILLLSMKKKPSYRIEVPAPEKITAEQFKQPSLLQKVSKAVQKVAPVAKFWAKIGCFGKIWLLVLPRKHPKILFQGRSDHLVPDIFLFCNFSS